MCGQAGIVVGGAQQSHRGPRILQRLVVFRLRDVEIPDDGQLADEAQPSGNEDSSSAGEASKKDKGRKAVE